MASMGWEKTGKRWRVFWHVTLPDGTVDKGSKSFKDKKVAQSFKEHCEKQEKSLKRSEIVEPVLLDEAVNHWIDFCQGYTDRTAKLYVSDVEKFIAFLPVSVAFITDLSKFHINSYLNSQMRRGLVNKSVNNTMCALKSLCKYIHENYNIDNPAGGIKKLKEDPAEVHFIDRQEYEAVVESCADFVRPWVVFLGNTGLRATELCSLKWKNCDFKRKTITVVGKGRKRRTIGLNSAALEVLENIREGRKVKAGDVVFLGPDGEPLNRHKLSRRIQKACRDSGLPSGGSHMLRHFFATRLLLLNIPIIKVSILLGHSSVTITQRHYAHILSSDLTGITDVLAG